jgi:hypothetical protein
LRDPIRYRRSQSDEQESELISRKVGLRVLFVVTIIIAVVDLLLPPIPQPQWYHLFADQRSFLGIPNFGDVVSNAPFAIFGVWGLIFLLRSSPEELSKHFLDRRERRFYVIIFIGLVLTAFGSSYYHLAPDNARLVWDRVPMTIVFMSLISALIAERISLTAGLRLLPILLFIGVGSVLQWYISELRGAGDLRFYATVQTYAILFLLMAFLFPRRYTFGSDLAIVAGFYVLAKVLETFDKQIFRQGHIVSGHTLKHLAAAFAGYWILRMIKRRRPIPSEAV